MKNLVMALMFLFLGLGSVTAQQGDNGKSYYDAEKTQPKEVYSYRVDAARPGAKIKHGPYFYYYENGKVKIAGSYKDDQKHGEWKYYDESGKMTKTEKYDNGRLL